MTGNDVGIILISEISDLFKHGKRGRLFAYG
jgi:hypothetical protein